MNFFKALSHRFLPPKIYFILCLLSGHKMYNMLCLLILYNSSVPQYMSLRFSHVITGHYMTLQQFIYPFHYWWISGCFHSLAIVNILPWTPNLDIWVGHLCKNFSRVYPMVKYLGRGAYLSPHLLGNAKLFFQVSPPLEDVSCLSSPMLDILSDF